MMRPTTYTEAEALATERCSALNVDVPIYRIYKSGKFTLDKSTGEHTVHNIICPDPEEKA